MSDWKIHDKTVLVTGATNGIGQATALELAEMGANVHIVSRNERRCRNTQDLIKQKTGQTISYYVADLSSLSQIKNFSQEFLKQNKRLHVLINNVGVFLRHRKESADGYEMTFALNHLGVFYLTHLLLDLVKKSSPSRIINVSSIAHRFGSIHFDDLQSSKNYTSMKAYSQSKLANVLFTRELAQRFNGNGVTVNVLHPGIVKSGFGLEENQKRSGISLMSIIGISPERGARTSVYLASSPEVSGISGGYFRNMRRVRLSRKAKDESVQKRLWEVSEQLVGLS